MTPSLDECIQDVRESTRMLGSAAKKAVHIIIPIEGQRYVWKKTQNELPVVRVYSVIGVTAMQVLFEGPIYQLLYGLYKNL